MTFDQAQADSFSNSRYGYGRVIIYFIIAVLLLIDFYAFVFHAFGNLTSTDLFFHWAIVGFSILFIFFSTIDCLIVREKSAAIIFNIVFAFIMYLYLYFGVLTYMNNISLVEVLGLNGANSFVHLNTIGLWIMFGIAFLNGVILLFAKKPAEEPVEEKEEKKLVAT